MGVTISEVGNSNLFAQGSLCSQWPIKPPRFCLENSPFLPITVPFWAKIEPVLTQNSRCAIAIGEASNHQIFAGTVGVSAMPDAWKEGKTVNS